jgi:uncharacterized membrane protein YhaH (DUF805 family)
MPVGGALWGVPRLSQVYAEHSTAKVDLSLKGKSLDEPKVNKQPFKEMNSEDFKALFRSYWNFKGELTRKEFYPRILMLVILAVPSVLVVSIPLIGPVYVLALAAGLSAVIVRRLRHMAMPWWLVFLLVVPGLGWIVLGILMALKGAKHPDGDGLSPAHRQVLGAALVTTAVFLALALVINQGSTSDSGGPSSSDDSQESAQVVEPEAPSSSAEP